MIMSQRQIDGLVQTNKRRALPGCFPPGQQEKRRRQGENPKEP